ncbi:MAG: hypothetical protein EOS78_22350 [Mesorhizobium sp.]|uniref:hypothetical protein n=1 Tax=unclassified Mesorhizobium TaxID=325217 RepID=UPI000F75E09E|nr:MULTISPECIES: hypothetical protein [unclassified Mesorhizobium]AZO55745.1 hypothetical protein EJ077_21710 [Mesorhizobium sp. M8A.F.Ca.ET.057.01.1.1]RWE33427.1 MAG: hypothetical protein EOS78_22350 [Mesorhizobium sp.]RWE40709.1 MAG: hypothetical protein EOS80_30210 [Mesorhizobium sp.]TJX80142.1 MAG: hypothetical protein E5W21_01345 [Mesorhizobium sp.]
MAQPNEEMREIMLQSRIERQGLFEPVSEISRRLQPRHLVGASTQYAKQKVAKALGGVSDAVKDNGGTAAALALGAVAVFDAGRRSAHGPASADHDAIDQDQVAAAMHSDAAPIRYEAHTRKAITNLSRAKVLAVSAGGLLFGHVIGKAFEPTAKERTLFGKAGADVQHATDAFMAEHARGAKLAAAQAFGFARYAAAFLAILSAASDYFARANEHDDQ